MPFIPQIFKANRAFLLVPKITIFASFRPGWHCLVCVMPEKWKSPITSLNGYTNWSTRPIGSMWSLLSRTLGMLTRSVALRAQTSTICLGNGCISSVMHGRWNTKMRSINQFSSNGCTNWSARPIGPMWSPLGRTLSSSTWFVASEGPYGLYGQCMGQAILGEGPHQQSDFFQTCAMN